MKKILSLFMIFGLVLTLCGCELDLMINTKINATGSGQVSVGFAVDEMMLALLSDGYDFSNQMTEYQENGTTYYGYDISYSFSSCSQLEQMLMTSFDLAGSSMDAIFSAVKVTTTSFSGVLNSYCNLFDFDGEELSYVTQFVKEKFSITFPNKIEETNGRVSEDGKTVTWYLTDYISGETMYAKTAKGFPLWIIGVAAGGLLVAGAVVFFVLTKGKKDSGYVSEYVLEKSAPVEPQLVFCPQCGAQVDSSSNFCNKCGARIKE